MSTALRDMLEPRGGLRQGCGQRQLDFSCAVSSPEPRLSLQTTVRPSPLPLRPLGGDQIT